MSSSTITPQQYPTLSDPESNEPLLQQSSPVSDLIPALNDQRRPVKVFSAVIASCLFLVSLVGLILNGQPPKSPANHQGGDSSSAVLPDNIWPVSRGKEEGVSEKAFRLQDGDNGSYPWTNAELSWQRTAYHFQPPNNWMNDPNAPMYYNGWYHLFYQYNPVAPVWGNISWGHAVSTDLIHWLYLPLAMVPDQPFDINGVWTGSATILPDGNITILYTGDAIDTVQVQNLAFPANLSDPLLLDWIKYQGNPVVKPPVGIGVQDFRDPTTGWLGSDGKWRTAIGSKISSTGTGIALVYTTTDFVTFEAVENLLHAVPGTGMWECVDFYPVNTTGFNGVDNSAGSGDGIKHVLKASLDDNKHDYYAIGTYDSGNDSWTPDNAALDVGIGMRVDYGKYYASKTFFDQYTDRRILWGWVAETDTEVDDVEKGWASVQTVPRVVIFDNKTGTNLLQWPVEEVESLRLNSTEVDDVLLEPGSTLNLNITSATQLDVSAEFVVDAEALNSTVAPDVFNNCTGTHVRGALGPFGVLVLADDTLAERTPVYFYVAKGTDGVVKHWFCTDKSRSTEANGVDKQVYGGPVPVLDDENFNMRILVDHSVVEAFGQGGRTCITSRIYPTVAIYENARIFLFNNATELNVTASIKVWSLANADIHPYPLDQI